jgi:hypothetical protein
VMTGRRGLLSPAAIGLIALIAGAGRLLQAYRDNDRNPAVPIPVLVAATGYGLVITALTIRAAGTIYLDGHPGVRASVLWLGILGASLVIVLAFVGGVANSGR